jgi:hypothetical protein
VFTPCVLQLEAVKILERALQNASSASVGDANLIEQCATVLFNTAQPFLQPETRMSVYRQLSSAASALQTIDSQRWVPAHWCASIDVAVLVCMPGVVML